MPQIKPDGQKITVIVSDNLNRRYDVIKKPNTSPSNTYKGKPIKWVTSFGFKPKPGISVAQSKLDNQGFMKGDLEESFTIKLAKDGTTLVYYDGSELRELSYKPKNAKMGDTVEATLKAGDPPVGWS